MADSAKRNPPAAGKGRPKGAVNKVTREVREITLGLFDDAYWDYTRRRLLSGRLAPAVEAKLLSYAYGEPKLPVDLTANVNVRTVVKHIYEQMADASR